MASTMLTSEPFYNQSEVWDYNSSANSTVVCYAPSMITTNGVWQNDNPLYFSLPLFILQLLVIVVTTRTIVYIFRPLRQPRVVWEILSGILLGPSAFGRIEIFAKNVFPLRSIMVLKTMANVGVLYCLFLVGVEMDLTQVKCTTKKSFAIAFTTMALPFIICISTAIMKLRYNGLQSLGLFILGSTVVSSTASSVLARFLADIKLFNSDLGRLSMSIALITDLCAWVLLIISAIVLREFHRDTYAPTTIFGIFKVGVPNTFLVVIYLLGFILFCVVVIRPAIMWVIKSTPEGESFNEFYICLILAGVMISGFLTDAMGTHSIFGAFIFGVIIPNEPLGTVLLEKLEDFVTALLLPLFFAISGLRTDLYKMLQSNGNNYAFLIFMAGCIGKMVSTFLLSLLHDMSLQDGFALAMLLNTRGLMELIMINIAIDLEALSQTAFSTMVFCILFLTSITTPAILNIYRPGRSIVTYRCRTIQRSRGNEEFRILTCVHTPRNVPTIINLLEASHPTKKSPICVYTLHLVELTGRASSMLIVHNAYKQGRPSINRTQAQSEHIINAFENYAQHTGYVTILPLTAISPYSTMHEDICNLAEDKRITFIIVPFHKQQTVDGGMEATNPAFRGVNQNVLINAPCSVGILIDRGLGGLTNISSNHTSHHIAVLFFGGPDDREAISYARRMAEYPSVHLSIIRFLPEDYSVEQTIQPKDHGALKLITDIEREKKFDDEYINKFISKMANDKTIEYKEKVVKHGEETVQTIRSIENRYDLYIVGRGQGVFSPLTEGLSEWSECPELGAIGDLLASSDFATTMSVLVVQQYVGDGTNEDGMATPKSPEDSIQPHYE